VCARFSREARSLKDGYAAALWAMEKHLRPTNLTVSKRIRELRLEVGQEFGLLSRVITGILGPFMLWSAKREERKLKRGHTYEPQTIIERRNWTASQIAELRVRASQMHAGAGPVAHSEAELFTITGQREPSNR
jgi:hypothetical protein